MKRACYGTVTYSPFGNVWTLQDSTYHIKWYEGDQVPCKLSLVLGDDTDEDDDNIAALSSYSDDVEDDIYVQRDKEVIMNMVHNDCYENMAIIKCI